MKLIVGISTQNSDCCEEAKTAVNWLIQKKPSLVTSYIAKRRDKVKGKY